MKLKNLFENALPHRQFLDLVFRRSQDLLNACAWYDDNTELKEQSGYSLDHGDSEPTYVYKHVGSFETCKFLVTIETSSELGLPNLVFGILTITDDYQVIFEVAAVSRDKYFTRVKSLAELKQIVEGIVGFASKFDYTQVEIPDADEENGELIMVKPDEDLDFQIMFYLIKE